MKKTLSIILTVMMIVGMIPLAAVTASAANTATVSYLDAAGNTAQAECTVIDEESDEWSGWMVVDGEVKIGGYILMTADTNLILKDNAVLILDGAVGHVVDGDKALTIYAQSTGDNAGKLIIANTDFGSNPAIEADLTVVGGTVDIEAEGSTSKSYGIEGKLTVKGGHVNVTSASSTGTAYGVYDVDSDGYSVDISGGSVAFRLASGNYGYGVYSRTSGGSVNISGGVLSIQNISQKYAYGIYDTSAGTSLNVSGGTVFIETSAASTSSGIYHNSSTGDAVKLTDGTAQIHGFNVVYGRSYNVEAPKIEVAGSDEVYSDWDSKTKLYNYQYLRLTKPHVHSYDQTVASDKFLKTPATYTTPAEYYKSCTCGETDKAVAGTFEGSTLPLSECFWQKVVEYGLQIGRQGKVGEDNSISTEAGRTIIPLTAEQLGEIGDCLTIAFADGSGTECANEYTVNVDCVYTYFYDVTDGEETKITAEELGYAAFIIIDRNDKGETVTGCGYYRIYNGEKADDSFMFDVLYPASAPAEPLVFDSELTSAVIEPIYTITMVRSTPDAMKEFLGRQIGKVSVKDVVKDLLNNFLKDRGINENDIYQATNKWMNDLSKGTDVDTLILDIDSTFPGMFTAEEYADLKYDLTQGDLPVPMIRVDTIEIPEDGRIELTIGNYKYVGQNGEWVYALADGATEPYGRPYDIIAGYPVVGSAR